MKKVKKLRLLLTEECHRKCPECCNKDYDLKSLSVFSVDDVDQYDQILITGGEPLNDIKRLMSVICEIRVRSDVPIIIYTASWVVSKLLIAIDLADGITYTLHDQGDFQIFHLLNRQLLRLKRKEILPPKSLRLNVFKGIYFPTYEDTHLWTIKRDMVWNKECPLPEGEVFMRYAWDV